MEVEQLVVDGQERGSLRWKEVNIGVVATYYCPCNRTTISRRATRVCTGDFTSGGRWMETDTSPCQFDELAWQLCNNVIVCACVCVYSLSWPYIFYYVHRI